MRHLGLAAAGNIGNRDITSLTRAAINAAATAGTLVTGEPYLISDEGRLAVATGASAYTAFAKTSETGAGSSSAITHVQQTAPVYVMREPWGVYAWTIVRGDGLRASPSNNPSYTTSAAAWSARDSLSYA